jgi:4-diphosphocytidyl-2-C-methyl-D-erythritol kinase
MTSISHTLRNCPAPAKLNLFLHVTGRRADGYHLLQSVFQLVDRSDMLHFTLREDGQIRRTTDLPGVPEQSDLVVRAARALQDAVEGRSGRRPAGADIELDKKLPMGGGLGGGSSDAATTLIALNHLWQAGLTRTDLIQLALPLGADIPFFLFGRNAFAEGVGEELVAIEMPERWFVVIEPGVQIPTAEIFNASQLTRDSKPVKITDFSGAIDNFGKNDLQGVAATLYPDVAEAISWLGEFGNAKMTGSGACVFCAFSQEQQADEVLQSVPSRWQAWKAKALARHPMEQMVNK